MVLGLLFELRSSTYLIVSFWEDICRLAGIVIFAAAVIELLHHIKEPIVVLRLNSWVLDDEAPILM